MLPSPWHYSLPIWWKLTRSGQPWRLQSCVTGLLLTPSFPVAYFNLTHLLVVTETLNVTDFYHPNPLKPWKWTLPKKKKSPLALRATALHKTHPWVHCTPFMIYITIRNQRSPSVKNVSWVWKSSGVFYFFALLDMGIDGERVNANNSFKLFLLSLLTSWMSLNDTSGAFSGTCCWCLQTAVYSIVVWK